MSRQLPGGDTKPWFRQFWPWFLIALPASVVVAGFATLYIANRHADDLVVDDYYKNGLAINRQLEKKQRAAAQGITAQLRFDPRSVSITVDGPVTSEQLLLLMSHPLEADRDFAVTVTSVEAGLYTAMLEAPVAPRWHWTLQNNQDATGWRLDGAVQAADIGDAASD